MPTAIDNLLRTTLFQGPGAAPPAPVMPARVPAAASTPAKAAFGGLGTASPAAQPPATATAPQGLATLMAALGQLGETPAAPPAPAALAPAVQQRIAKALSNMASDSTPLWMSADTIAGIGADTATLSEAFAQLGFFAELDFDARGGVLVAPSPDILKKAVAARDQGRSVPILPVKLEVSGGPRGRGVSARPAPRGTGS